MLTRALSQHFIGFVTRQGHSNVLVAAFGDEPTELAAPVEHVLDSWVIHPWVVVRRKVRVGFQLLISDGDVQGVA